jgi:hypothetical protein
VNIGLSNGIVYHVDTEGQLVLLLGFSTGMHELLYGTTGPPQVWLNDRTSVRTNAVLYGPGLFP